MTNDEMTLEAHKQIVPSRSWQLPLSGRETARKNEKSEKCARLQMESGFR